MKKNKYIFVLLLMIATTLVINGGTKSEPCIVVKEQKEPGEKAVLEGFPDLITFTNYIN